MITQPMACARCEDTSLLRYPLLVTPKIDGIRCLKLGGQALTRAFKRVQNRHVRELVEAYIPDGTDGELVFGDFSSTQTAVMRSDAVLDFRYFVFDFVHDLRHPYSARAYSLTTCKWAPFVQLLLPTLVTSEKELLVYEEACIKAGWEGVCLRDPNGPYKCGRSTLREGWLMKLKRFQDSEAVVLGFEEQMENTNPIERNAFGRAKRPGGKSNHVPKGTLGGFLVRDIRTGVRFSIGTGKGLTQELRQHIWDCRDQYLGKVLTYQYQDVGSVEKPRFPSFKGWRYE